MNNLLLIIIIDSPLKSFSFDRFGNLIKKLNYVDY